MDPPHSTEVAGGAGGVIMPDLPPQGLPPAPRQQQSGGQGPRYGVKYRAYTEDDMRRAAQAIMGGMSLRKASVTHNVPKTTLAERMGDRRPRIPPRKDAAGGANGNEKGSGGEQNGSGEADGEGAQAPSASRRSYTRYTWTETEMENAVRAVRAGETVRVAARRFGVPPSNLNSRTRGREPRDLKGEVSRLTLKQESLLAEWASAQGQLGFPPTKDEVFDLAERVLRKSTADAAPSGDGAEKKLGKQWIGHWMRRWPNVEVLDWKAKQGSETRKRAPSLFDDSHFSVIQDSDHQQQEQQQQGLTAG